MRCLQCGQLGVGLTLVVSEPQDAQDDVVVQRPALFDGQPGRVDVASRRHPLSPRAACWWIPLSLLLQPELPLVPSWPPWVPRGLPHQAHNSGVLSACAVRWGRVQEDCQYSSIPYTSRQGKTPAGRWRPAGPGHKLLL